MDKDLWGWLKHISFPTVIERVKTQGVLTPLLWLCGLSYVSTVIVAFTGSPVVWALLVLSATSTYCVFRNFEYFRDKRPELLLTESFQLAHQKTLLAYQQQLGTIIDSKPVSKSSAQQGRLMGNEDAER